MTPQSFKAAILVRTGSPLELISGIEIPDLRQGQVLVKIAYAGLCHSQVMEARGHRGVDAYLPHMLGHEGTGHVVATGPKVEKIKVGDRVVLGWIKGEGHEARGTVYSSPIGNINAGGVTTFGEYAIVSENRCVPLPDFIPMDIGVLLGCALPTGAGIVLNQLRPAEGITAGVLGLGGIGLSALLALSIFKPKTLVAIDCEQAKLDFAKELGATHTCLAGDATEDEIKQLTAGAGLDACIEAAGHAATIELGVKLVRRNGGRCIFASHPPAGDMIRLDPFDLISGKKIEGSWGGASHPDVDIPRIASLFTSNKLPLRRLLSHVYSLDNINQSLDDLESRRIVRALIEISPP